MNKFDDDFIQVNKQKVKDETQNLVLYFITHIFFYVVLVVFALFFFWYTIFVCTHSFYEVNGPSMMQTLNSQITDTQLYTLPSDKLRELSFDAVYIDRTTKIKLFDIIAIKDSSGDLMKRLLANAGDYITISIDEDGDSYYHFYRIPKGADLNTFSDEDAKLDESVGQYTIRSYQEWTERETATAAKTANDHETSHVYEKKFYDKFLKEYFDNKDKENFDIANLKYNYHISEDGLVYVQVPEKRFFYMGDNRAFSSDARESGFGVIKNIVGRGEFIVKNYSFVNRVAEVMKFYFSEMQKFFAR